METAPTSAPSAAAAAATGTPSSSTLETALIVMGIVGGAAALLAVARWYWDLYHEFCGGSGARRRPCTPQPMKDARGWSNRRSQASSSAEVSLPRGRADRSSPAILYEGDGTADTAASTPPRAAPALGHETLDSVAVDQWCGWDHCATVLGYDKYTGRTSAIGSMDVETGTPHTLDLKTVQFQHKPQIDRDAGIQRPQHFRTPSTASTVKMSSSRNRSHTDDYDLDSNQGRGARPDDVDRERGGESQSDASAAVHLPGKEEGGPVKEDAHVLERWKRKASKRFNPSGTAALCADATLPTVESDVEVPQVPQQPHDDASDSSHRQATGRPSSRRPTLLGRSALRLVDDWVNCRTYLSSSRRDEGGEEPPRLGIGPTPIDTYPERSQRPGSGPHEAASGNDEAEVHADPQEGGRLGIGPFLLLRRS